jgi:serine phosphatase RsbU (regulator of sigma subunit)
LSRSTKTPADTSGTPIAWNTARLRARSVFLFAVFFFFTGIGIAVDVVNMGRQSKLHFALSAGLFGLFAVAYAASGVILRGKFLRALFPIILLQIICTTLVAYLLPDQPAAGSFNATRVERRLAFDGWAIIVSVALGYAGFVASFVSEARRYIKAHAVQARLEGEMAAAREVQRVMVPEAVPPVPGYAIDSVYWPASEVGGDFFQIIPLRSGRSLAVIGDVSGKGLQAAMIVSMIVGMLSIIGGFTEQPGEILAELNRRLYGRTHGGFATCLAVRLEAEGRLTLSSAGHPAPYLNGHEILLPGSMPLGLTEDESYPQSSFDMRPGEFAVLLTDGIPEARNDAGEIFGFPRVESLLRDGAPAKALAEAAQQHGQNDDLTVIGIARQA